MARYWFRLRKLVLHNVLHADDTPHAISLGVAIATAVAFLPLMGLQTIISIGLAALCRANKAVCVPIVWITNPVTAVPIYGACYALGRLVLPVSAPSAEAEVLENLEKAPQHSDFFSVATWKHIFDQLATLGMELWVGCLIVGVFFGVVGYFGTRWAVVHYRERRRQRILKRNLLRAHRRATAISRREEVA